MVSPSEMPITFPENSGAGDEPTNAIKPRRRQSLRINMAASLLQGIEAVWRSRLSVSVGNGYCTRSSAILSPYTG